jgi:MFS family permease
MMKIRRDPALMYLAIGQTLIWASIYYVFPVLLLRWEHDLGWSKSDLTLAISLAVLVSAAAAPFSGRIIDRGFGAPLVGLSAVLGGMGLLLLSGVRELWQFYLVWIIIGFAMAGCLYEPCFALITRARGAQAKKAIIVITLVAGFASTISYPLIYMLSEALGWRGAIRVVAALVICGVAPLLWFGARKLNTGQIKPPETAHKTGSSRAFLKTPVFWYLASGFACLAVFQGSIIHHLFPILDERGFSDKMAVVIASLIGPMQVVGRLAMMASGRYLSTHGVAVAAFMVMGLAITVLFIGGSSAAYLVLFAILFGSAYGTVSIIRPLLVREILGETDFGVKSGALALPYLAGAASAPFLGSLIWGIGGYDLLLEVLMGFVILGGLLYSNANCLACREARLQGREERLPR